MNNLTVLITADSAIPPTYIKAVESVNLTPIFDVYANADALILSGGGDVSPCLYGKYNPNVTKTNLLRDCTESFLIKRFLNERKPILGICRGMQMLNVFYGGTLFENSQNLNAHLGSERNGDKTHLIKTVQGTFLNSLYGKALTSNSYHHQQIESLGKNLVVSACSLDGVIEAFENDFVFGVQFHPERMNTPISSCGIKIFEHFKEKIISLKQVQ